MLYLLSNNCAITYSCSNLFAVDVIKCGSYVTSLLVVAPSNESLAAFAVLAPQCRLLQIGRALYTMQWILFNHVNVRQSFLQGLAHVERRCLRWYSSTDTKPLLPDACVQLVIDLQRRVNCARVCLNIA